MRLIDFMPPRGENPDIIRIIEGLRGKVSMQMELIIRFDYGHILPWVRRRKRFDGLEAVAGPDALILRTPVETHGKDLTTVAEFTVAKGDRIPFVLTWFASHTDPPRKINPEHALHDTEVFWGDWAKRFESEREMARRDSALTHYVERIDLCANWRVGCGAYHFVARANRRSSQLGLSLLLVARCGADFTRVTPRGLSRGGEILAGMAVCAPSPAVRRKCKRSTA